MHLDERQWAQVGDQVVEHLSRLIRFDTSNPPGNETPAALYLKQILEREGVEELQLLESAPRRGNLVARLRGDGSKRPLLLSTHLDVVPAEPEHWTHPPFSGTVADGMVWGRGALDMKHMAAMSLGVVLLARRLQLPLKRDIIFAAVADEEMAFDYGSRWLVENHPDLVRAEYGLSEMGGMLTPIAGRRCYPIQVAEKGVCWLRMRTSGQPGHGSTPHGDNAVVHLARALARLGDGRGMPIHLTRVAAGCLRTLAAGLPPRERLLLHGLLNRRLAPLALRGLPPEQRNDLRALLCNTVTPTRLQAGVKTNVIPSQAEAELDCRLLPGQMPEDAIREIRAIVGTVVDLDPLKVSPGVEFESNTELYDVVRRTLVAHDPAALPVPYMATAATDARQYARLGTTVYGFTPGQLEGDMQMMRLIHGHDERIPVASLHFGVRVLYDVVKEFCC
ncbi:MAG TPA: M20/M25/M40 family metallo-hydrolase [Anaerolineae bacterium]|nr:M20/M25/M40 family metallo-hydrolase [Anaerolineae bacterium]